MVKELPKYYSNIDAALKPISDYFQQQNKGISKGKNELNTEILFFSFDKGFGVNKQELNHEETLQQFLPTPLSVLYNKFRYIQELGQNIEGFDIKIRMLKQIEE